MSVLSASRRLTHQRTNGRPASRQLITLSFRFFEGVDAAGEEALVSGVGGEVVSTPVRRDRLVRAVEAAQEVGAGGVQQVVALEAVDPVDQGQPVARGGG